MNDTMKIFRLAVFDRLNGIISVPVYDEKRTVKAEKTPLYVILSTQQEDDDDQTSETFITNSSIDLEIIHESGYEITKDRIDDISQEILTALLPGPGGDFAVTADYQIIGLRRRSTLSRNFSLSDDASMITKIISLSAKIVQRNPYF